MSEMQLVAELPLQQLTLFNSLFTTGLVLLTVVMLPAIISRNVQRSTLWFAFMGSWTLYCVSGLLLVSHQLGPDPPFGICLLQAALIHSVPTLATIAGVCFIVDLFCTLKIALRSYWIPMRRTPALLAVPGVAFLVLFFLSLGIGLHDHTTVSRVQNMFCHINTGLPTLIGAILSGWAAVIAIGVEVTAAIMLYRIRPTLTPEKSLSESSEPLIALSMVIRILLFSLLTLLGLILNATMLFHFDDMDIDIQAHIMLPILPILMAVLFGAQKDIILGWRFWKHETKGAQTGAV